MNRRHLLRLAVCGLAARALPQAAPACAQNPQFNDADRTRDKIVVAVRVFEPGHAKSLPATQRIQPVPEVAVAGVQASPDQLPLIDYFVGDLQLRYSFDEGRYLTSVSAADLKRLKLRREELLPLAIANFRRFYAGYQVERMPGGLASVVNAGGLEPSLMLDAGFWDLERNRAGSELVASVPARDTLLFAGRKVEAHVDVLRRITQNVHGSAGNDALSRKLFLWSKGRWEVFS